MLGAVDLGLIFGLMALGVYLTFRILDFADLTVDGSFTTGGAITATLITGGVSPLLATLCGGVGGLAAGAVTGLLNTKGRIHPLLAGILTQIALYSINLRIMGRANKPLLRMNTLFSPLRDAGLLGTPASIGILAGVVALFVVALDWFLGTDLGLALRATGDNDQMARAQGINTGAMKVLGLALSNGLVALSGGLLAQYQGFADIGMGIGMIVAGLASVIIGTAILDSALVWVATIAVVVGSIVYRLVIQLALSVGLNPNDMKLVSAVIVVIALLLPRWRPLARLQARRMAHNLPAEPDIAPEPEEADPEAGLFTPGSRHA